MSEQYWPEGLSEDEFLRRALLLANSPEVMGLHDEEMAFSPRFERRMNRLTSSPFRRARQELRPRWVKVLNAAAMVALVLTVALSAVMLNPTARAWFELVVTQWQTYGVEFIFRGSAEGEAGTWTAGYLPEGYVSSAPPTEINGTWNYAYIDSDSNTILLKAMPIQQGKGFTVDREHSDYEPITVNGRPADLFRSNTDGKPSYLFWTDNEEITAFLLMSEINPDELIKIAESVTPIK